MSCDARAFFYAGARAKFVSHWAVNSDATVKLITRAFDEIKADPKIGRAEALRRSMLALVSTAGHTAIPRTGLHLCWSARGRRRCERCRVTAFPAPPVALRWQRSAISKAMGRLAVTNNQGAATR